MILSGEMIKARDEKEVDLEEVGRETAALTAAAMVTKLIRENFHFLRMNEEVEFGGGSD